MKVRKQVTFRRSNYCGDSATKERCSLYVGSYVTDLLFVFDIVDFGGLSLLPSLHITDSELSSTKLIGSSRQGTSSQYHYRYLYLVIWYWSVFVSSTNSIQIVRRQCCLGSSLHFKDLDIPYTWHNGIGTTSCSVCLINLSRVAEVGTFPANKKMLSILSSGAYLLICDKKCYFCAYLQTHGDIVFGILASKAQ